MTLFCPLERIELRTDVCPIRRCMYRKKNGECRHDELNREEGVTAQTIAETKHLKMYKVKAKAASSRDAIEIGIVVDRYAEYIRDSFPESANVVNETYENEVLITRVLRKVFRLSHTQQEKFWEPTRYEEWKRRHSIEFQLVQLTQTLKFISFQFADPISRS